ncbi:MAG: zinc ribbon domain-containing protein, partial [Nitrososphaeraceae archaeon]
SESKGNKSHVSMLSNMMMSPYMLHVARYKVDILDSSMGAKFKDIDQVEVHPIEWDGMLFFSDGKKNTKKTFSLDISDIVELYKATETKGRVIKKENLVVEIIFRQRFTEHNNEYKIKIKIEDNHVDEFINKVHFIIRKATDKEYWTSRKIRLASDNNELQKETEIFINAPFLADNEKIVWFKTTIEGNKKSKEKLLSCQVLTNCRVYEYDFENHSGNGILLPLIQDLKIMNIRFTETPNTIGIYADSHESTDYESRNVSTLEIGDIVVAAEGGHSITFDKVGDPRRLLSTINHIIGRDKIRLMDYDNQIHVGSNDLPHLNSVTKPKDKEIKAELEVVKQPIDPLLEFKNNTNYDFNNYNSKQTSKSREIESMQKSINIHCNKCDNDNLYDSKFCNKCGAKLDTLCPRCGNVSLEDSKFCNNCGFDLLSNMNSSNDIQTSSPPVRSDDLRVEFEMCELSAYGMRILYPLDWTKYDHGLDPPNIAYFLSPKESANDKFFDGVAISVTTNIPRAATLETALKTNLDDLKVSTSNFVLEETNKATLSNQPAYKIVYRDGGYKTLAALTLRQSLNSNSLVIVIYRALPSSYDRFLPIVNKMIQSFEFTD